MNSLLCPGAKAHELVVLFGQITLHQPPLPAISFFLFTVVHLCTAN